MIQDKKKLTIFTIMIAIAICIVLLVFGYIYMSNGNELILQQNQSVVLFLFVVAIFWLVVCLFYKIIKVERLIFNNQELLSKNQKLLQEILLNQENDFYDINQRMQNDRDILLKLFDDKVNNTNVKKFRRQ